MHRVLVLVLAAVAFAGPASAAPKFTVNDIVNSGAKLNGQNSVLIAVPRDGSFGGRVYSGSGVQTAEATRNVFARKLNKVSLESETGEDTSAGLAKAVSGGYSHFCQLEILHWEDRNTEWSGKRDKIEVKFTLYDAATGQIVRSSTIASVSKFWTFGGDHPQELADAHMHVLIDLLF